MFRSNACLYEVAIVHAGLSEADAAFTWLDRAYEERSEALLYVNVGPLLDPIRSDPRFAALAPGSDCRRAERRLIGVELSQSRRK